MAGPLRDALTGAPRNASEAGGAISIPAAAIFDRLPIALLVPR
jgi:hypothetical protein